MSDFKRHFKDFFNDDDDTHVWRLKDMKPSLQERLYGDDFTEETAEWLKKKRKKEKAGEMNNFKKYLNKLAWEEEALREYNKADIIHDMVVDLVDRFNMLKSLAQDDEDLADLFYDDIVEVFNKFIKHPSPNLDLDNWADSSD